MPWHQEPKKDVTSCDKLWVGANIRSSTDFRMRERTCCNEHVSYTEYIGIEKATRGTETSKYREEEKSTEIPRVVASESGRGQTDGKTAKKFIARAVLRKVSLIGLYT